MSKEKKYCGLISIVGRANVGKSTLMNQLLGQKISITSRKPETTRHQIIGINTKGAYQAVYVDTPGLHVAEKSIIHCITNRLSISSITNVELVILVVEGTHWTTDDTLVLKKLTNLQSPVVLAINKVDNIKCKSHLLPYIEMLSAKKSFLDIVPISAKKKINLDIIASIVKKLLPESEHYFPDNYITDRSYRFVASEIIREKLMRFLDKELPYSVMVKIEQFFQNDLGDYTIYALILVPREGQKKIVIGNQGIKIKAISVAACQDIQRTMKTKVHLELWVKVKSS